MPNPCAVRRSILQPPRRKMLPPVNDPTECNYIAAKAAAKAGKPGCPTCHTAGIECPLCICCPCCVSIKMHYKIVIILWKNAYIML